ncbi:hypothetical protein [Bacteroides coprosuis]|uniref:hypothetical protein n=1 Tax=Bacteroides coprosuis TaxID=151276 RepID=UPI001D60A961|nr:hypothetical protein [Bacteroides coprosuis]HJD92488.1 hypothetical protein [Bacteroides coprosuis]
MQQEVTLSKKSCSKYGVLSMIGWNVLIISLLLATQKPLEALLTSDGLRLSGMGFLFFLWSGIWFFIGYQYRKKYLRQKEDYKEEYSEEEQKDFDKAYFQYCLSKNTKAISTVLFITIPWYFIGYVQGDTMHMRDYIVMGILLLISATLYGIHKRYRNTL